MSLNKNNKGDYDSLSSLKNNGGKRSGDQASLKPPGKLRQGQQPDGFLDENGKLDRKQNSKQKIVSHHLANGKEELSNAEIPVLKPKVLNVEKEEPKAETLDRSSETRFNGEINNGDISAV